MNAVEYENPVRQPALAGTGLLHNMSCRPSTSIVHESPAVRSYGQGIVYSLPDEVQADSAQKLLAWVGGEASGKQFADAEQELLRRIQKCAASLPLPATAVVSDTCRENDSVCKDRLSVLTVLAKSSAHVYLRDKHPNLSSIRPGRRVVVIVPPSDGEQQ